MDRQISRNGNLSLDQVETQSMPTPQLFASGSNVPCKNIDSGESSTLGTWNVVKPSSLIDRRAHGKAKNKSVISLRSKGIQGVRIEQGRLQAIDIRPLDNTNLDRINGNHSSLRNSISAQVLERGPVLMLSPNSPSIGNLNHPHLPCKRKIDELVESSSRVHPGNAFVHPDSSPSNYSSGTNIPESNLSVSASANQPYDVTQNVESSQRNSRLRIDPSPHKQRSPGNNQFVRFNQSAESSSRVVIQSATSNIQRTVSLAPALAQDIHPLPVTLASSSRTDNSSRSPSYSRILPNNNVLLMQHSPNLRTVSLTGSTFSQTNAVISWQRYGAQIAERNARISPSNNVPADTRNFIQQNSNLGLAPSSQDGPSLLVSQLSSAPPFSQNQNLHATQANLASSSQALIDFGQTSTAPRVETNLRMRNLVQQSSNSRVVPMSQAGPSACVAQLSAPAISQSQNQYLRPLQTNFTSISQSSVISEQRSTVETNLRILPRNLVQQTSGLRVGPVSEAGYGAHVGQFSAAVSQGSSITSAGSVSGPGQSANVVVAPQNSASSDNVQEIRNQVANLLRGFRESQRRLSDGLHRANTLRFMEYLHLTFGGTRGLRQFLDMLLSGDARTHAGEARLHDGHRDLRLDVDNMSYEELLALGERIGYVNMGISEERILKLLKQCRYISPAQEMPSDAESCCICQEEYMENDIIGRLDCGHDFHTNCIKQWLVLKNLCPICRTTGLTA